MHKDYIMRMIEEFFRALARVMMARETKQYANALVDLDGLSQKVTGFGLEHLMSLGAEGIVYVFRKDKDSAAEKIYCSARILKEEGLIFEAQGKIDDSSKRFLIAKELFRVTSELDFPEKDEAMKEFEELRIIK